jgi:hypothetical protein
VHSPAWWSRALGSSLQETGGYLVKLTSEYQVKSFGSSPLTFHSPAKYARMPLLHDAILIFQWDWSEVAAIYIFVNKLSCRVSMGKGRCYFIWKMGMCSVPELVFIILAYTRWDSWGKNLNKCDGKIPNRYAHFLEPSLMRASQRLLWQMVSSIHTHIIVHLEMTQAQEKSKGVGVFCFKFFPVLQSLMR